MERAADRIMSGEHPQCIWCGEKGQGSDYTSIGVTAWCQDAAITRSEMGVSSLREDQRERLNVTVGPREAIRSVRRVKKGNLGPHQAKQHIKEKNAKIKEICHTNPAERVCVCVCVGLVECVTLPPLSPLDCKRAQERGDTAILRFVLVQQAR